MIRLRVIMLALPMMGLILSAVVLGTSPLTYAAQSSSTNYGVDEVFFGTGGELNACSTLYCAKQAAGEMGVGRTASTNYSAQSGFNTDRQPSLTFTVSGGTTDLGVLSTVGTSYTTATVSVKTYLAGGYVVQTVSDPPSTSGTGSHTLNALTTPTASIIGTEQFGINLVANTSPATFGANPVQVPDASFSYGIAASGYNTANLFKYIKGDTVASSARSSGETDYTVSYIYNVGTNTQSGQYVFNHTLVATSTF